VLFRRSLILVGGRALSDALQLLLYVAIVRRFSETEIGDYSFAFALAMVLGLVVGLGARSLVTREVSNAPELGPVFPINLLVLHGALSLVAAMGLLAWANYAGLSGFLTALCLLALVSAGLATMGYGAIAVVDASGRVERGAQAEIIGKASTVLLGFGALLAGFDLVIIMVAQVVGSIVYLLLAMHWAAQAYGPLAWRIDWRLIARTTRSAIPFALAALLYALYARVDIIMLHRIAGPAETAFYAVAYRVVETTFVIASMTGIAMFPELAAGGQAGTDKRRVIFGEAVRWLAMLGAGVAVVLLVAGDRLATLVFGGDFAPAGNLLQAMALLVVIGYVKEPFWRLLLSQRREVLQLGIQAGAVSLNIGLNLLLIPTYGAMGAVVASLVSESLMLTGFMLAILRRGWISVPRVAGWVASITLACLGGLGVRLVADPLVAGLFAVACLVALLVVFRVLLVGEIVTLLRRMREERAA
jgi:O-antigen/teichoic acid export membrane protein